MNLDDDTEYREFSSSAVPITLRIGALTIELSSKPHDDLTWPDLAWTPLEPLPTSEVPSGLKEMIRLDFRAPAACGTQPDFLAGEDDEPPAPEPNPPIPPPKETPS